MTRPLRTLLQLLSLGLVLVLASPAWAQQNPRAEAKRHYDAGKSLFDQGQYEQAIEEFRAADALAPSGWNDFNIALSYEALSDEDNAIRHYQAFLDREPAAQNKATVQASIANLKAQRQAELAAEDEERKRLAAEEARRIEEEARKRPPPDGGEVGGVVGGVVGGTTSTGDPELDRVSAIDVGAVGAQRGQMGYAGGGGGAVQGPPPPNGAPPPVEPQPQRKAKPIYKQWWFWVVVGVSAYVLISIAAADSDDGEFRTQPVEGGLQRALLPPPGQMASGGGATLWRF